MSTHAIFRAPEPYNEPVRTTTRPARPSARSFGAGSASSNRSSSTSRSLIGGEEIRTGDTFDAVEPHNRSHVLATVHKGGAAEVERAIAAAGDAWHDWSRTPWEERAAVILRASELLAGPWRSTLNAATMLGQSKTAHQAEIDAACELIDFWRFNVEYMTRIYAEQPASSPGVWNRIEYRPLEGFVFAVTPFNFTAIGGNLPTSAALMGNTVVWKPASTAAYSAWWLMKLYEEAGMPPGVINLVYGSGAAIGDPALASPDLAGIHFTGSTGVFNGMWSTVASNLDRYRNYPRIVGETGGKDFIVAHRSAEAASLATAIVRGSFEYQGQKCSAASRVFVPSNLWPEVRDRARRRSRDDSHGRRLRLLELHGRGDRRQLVRDAEGGDRRGARVRRHRVGARRRRLRRLGGLLRRADGDRDDRPGLPHDARRAVRSRRDRVRLRREEVRRHARPDRRAARRTG